MRLETFNQAEDARVGLGVAGHVWCDDRFEKLGDAEAFQNGPLERVIAVGDRHHVLTRRKEIDQRTFLPASSRGRKGQHRRGRLEDVLQACRDAQQDCGELRPSMVDQRPFQFG